ncbi:MAG: peptidyl-prolyl cis-trans isomerase [Armatimonadota bacterium]
MLLTFRYFAILPAIAVAVVLTISGCGNSPVATVGGVKITEQEVDERLVQAFGEQVLQSMIDRELLQRAAEERGIEVTEEKMAEAIEEMKAQYPTEEAFQQELARNNMSEEEWLEEVRIMVLARELALHGVDPTEEELREFYEENRESFGEPAMVSMSEIVVTSESEAQEVLAELEGGDASFADLASRYSLAGSREAGGERPPVPIEQISQPEIREVAENLPVGEVSDPIEAGGSWVILRIRDRTQAREASFEEDREEIEEGYKRANANSLEEILQEQVEDVNINIIDPRFQGLSEHYTATPDEIPEFGAGDTQQTPPGGQMPPAEGHEGHDHAAPQPVPDEAVPDAPPITE